MTKLDRGHVIVNIPALLRFYDDDPTSRRHSNAIKTVAGEELGLRLLESYLESQGCQPTRIEAPCRTGGARLDGWVKVHAPSPLLYQVEVKSWSVHGYGGTKRDRLEVQAAHERLAEYKMYTWQRYWDDEKGRFKDSKINKVLTAMDVPKGEGSIAIQPLACLWPAMHDRGDMSPFFTVVPKGSTFAQLHVFSISAFLRTLLFSGQERVVLPLPDTSTRVEILHRLFEPQ